jgi:hypothetical protein
MSEADEDNTAARFQQLNERFYTADPPTPSVFDYPRWCRSPGEQETCLAC